MRKMAGSSSFLSRNWGNSPFLRYSFRVARAIICFNRCVADTYTFDTFSNTFLNIFIV